MGFNFYNAKSEMLDINQLEAAYNSLPTDIKDNLAIRSSEIEISGFKQFLHFFYDRCLKYEKDELEYAKTKFLSLFFDNRHLITKLKKMETLSATMNDANSWQDKKIYLSKDTNKKNEVRGNVMENKETNKTKTSINGVTLTSDANSGGEIVAQGCTPEASGMIKFEKVAFPTNAATQDFNDNTVDLNGGISSVASGYTDTSWSDERNNLMMSINPAMSIAALMGYDFPDLRKIFWRKFESLFI